MSESVPPRPSGSAPLPLREIALLTAAIAAVSGVSFGLGYVHGRDEAAVARDVGPRRGIDSELANEELVRLLAEIEVSDAADQGLSELRYPTELRGRPQQRQQPSTEGGFVLELAAVPPERLDEVREALSGRLGDGHTVRTVEGTTRVVIGGFPSAREAAAWQPAVDDVVTGLGLEASTIARSTGDLN